MSRHHLSDVGVLVERPDDPRWEGIFWHTSRGAWDSNISDFDDRQMVRIHMTSFDGGDFAMAATHGFHMRSTYFERAGNPLMGTWDQQESGWNYLNFGTNTFKNIEIIASWGGGHAGNDIWGGTIVMECEKWTAIGYIEWTGLLALKQKADKWFTITIEGVRRG